MVRWTKTKQGWKFQKLFNGWVKNFMILWRIFVLVFEAVKFVETATEINAVLTSCIGIFVELYVIILGFN